MRGESSYGFRNFPRFTMGSLETCTSRRRNDGRLLLFNAKRIAGMGNNKDNQTGFGYGNYTDVSRFHNLVTNMSYVCSNK